jgi:hypothetical protein
MTTLKNLHENQCLTFHRLVVVRYHSGGSMKLNACNLLLAHMIYL